MCVWLFLLLLQWFVDEDELNEDELVLLWLLLIVVVERGLAQLRLSEFESEWWWLLW